MLRPLLLALLSFSALPARAEILLKGIATTQDASLFSLYSTEDQTGKWISVGQNFAGYSVAEFRRDQEVLVLKKGEQLIELRIVAAKIPVDDSIAVEAAIKELTLKVGEGFRVHGKSMSVIDGFLVVKGAAVLRTARGQVETDEIRIELSSGILRIVGGARFTVRSAEGASEPGSDR